MLAATDNKSVQCKLCHIFKKQIGRTHCGVQSSALAMSAAAKPYKDQYDDKKEAIELGIEDAEISEDGLLEMEVTQSVIDAASLSKAGITLDELEKLLQAHGLKTCVQYANETSIDEFRDKARLAMQKQDSSQAVIVNYFMSALGQEPFGGHHSPIAAYDKNTDCFLILDTWPDTPVAWVPTKYLFAAMNTVDKSSNKHRGFCIIHF